MSRVLNFSPLGTSLSNMGFLLKTHQFAWDRVYVVKDVASWEKVKGGVVDMCPLPHSSFMAFKKCGQSFFFAARSVTGSPFSLNPLNLRVREDIGATSSGIFG